MHIEEGLLSRQKWMRNFLKEILGLYLTRAEGNTRTTVTFCCQYADTVGLWPDRELFENNAQCVRIAMEAYNAIFDDLGDKSQPNYLITFVEDAIGRGRKKWGSI